MQWYLAALKKYATFSGRARRKEFWMYTLFNMLLAIVLIAAGFAISENVGVVVYALYFVGMFLPSLAVTVRRLHDTGRSGWWYFISFVPAVGGIILLVFLCSESKPEHNEYGPNPKLVPAA